jgi:beta-1,4-N-acetylglucosaminyltransferase
MKILLEAGPGGHLVEMSRIWPALTEHDLILVTNPVAVETTAALRERFPFRTVLIPHRFADFKGNVFADYAMSFLVDILGNSLFLARLFHRERPGAVITTGAATTIVSSLMARISGARFIFIESPARIWSPSLNGRMAYWMADLFLVQWESLLPRYGKKAQYWGGLV